MWRAETKITKRIFSTVARPPVIRQLPISRFIPKQIKIEPHQMSSLEACPSGLFELMFSTKPGIPVPHFPITHSAIALHNPEHNLFAVYGRQSPYDISTWFKSGFRLFTETDNEKKYLSPNFHFTAYASGVFFTRAEVDSFLETANRLINQGTTCNMINSNCYSFSVTAMTLAIDKLLSREIVSARDISRVMTLIEGHPLADHCSIGVLNNEIVVRQMLQMLSKVQVQFQPPTEATHVFSEDESYVYQQSCLLLDRISTEATKYRIPSYIAKQLS